MPTNSSGQDWWRGGTPTEPRALYLGDLPHLLGGNGDQPLDTRLLQFPLLLDDFLEDVVDVDSALGGNLGNKYGGGEVLDWAVGPRAGPALPEHTVHHLFPFA